MTTSAVIATRLKPGDLFLLDGQGDDIFKVKKLSAASPGKHGHAKVRIMYVNFFTGSGGEVTYSGHKEMDKPVIEKERSQVISITPGKTSNDPNVPDVPAELQLMNLESFETYELPCPDGISEADLAVGSEVEVRKFESKKWIEKLI